MIAAFLRLEAASGALLALAARAVAKTPLGPAVAAGFDTKLPVGFADRRAAK
jgi:hypothetical protein